jgi:hypothetical protein
VNRSLAAEIFHSNLDIHVTSENECALAFQIFVAPGRYAWWASLHVAAHDSQMVVRDLVHAFDIVWQRGESFLFKDVYDQNAENVAAEQTRLTNRLFTKIDELCK